MFKTLIKILLSLVAMLFVIVGALLFFVDPNQYKAAIEEAVYDNTGYTLNIAGDLELTFSPYLGITLNDVRITNAGKPQELASTSRVSLKVDAARLLQREFLIQEFRADDFHVNVFVDSEGVSIWETTNVPAQRARADESSSNEVAAEFERISIANASIDYQDLSTGTRASISNLNIESRNSRLDGTPFPIEASFTFLNNGMSAPTTMAFNSMLGINSNAGQINLSEAQFSLTPMLLEGQIEITGLNARPRIEGSFSSNAFDLLALMETLGMRESPEEFIGASNTTPPLQFAFDVAGNDREFIIPALTATLGAAELEGDASVRFATEFTPMIVRYEIAANTIDLTPFFPEQESEPEADLLVEDAEETVEIASQTSTQEFPLPLDMLSDMNLTGSIAIEGLRYNDMELRDINIFTNLEDGMLDVETQPVTAYAGTIQGNLRLDSNGNLDTSASVAQLDLVELAPSISRINSVTGKLNVESTYTASGQTVSSMIESLTGSTSFAITENLVDISLIKQVFTAIVALSPSGDTVQQWPDQVSFNQFAGYILLDGGIAENQEVRLRMDNFDVSGSGGLDLSAGTFDYDLEFTVLGAPELQTIPINERYHNVSWPVTCSAEFSAEVSRYCRPDLIQVRDIFAQLGRNEVQRRLEDVVEDQAPEELRDAARGLLRNIFN